MKKIKNALIKLMCKIAYEIHFYCYTKYENEYAEYFINDYSEIYDEGFSAGIDQGFKSGYEIGSKHGYETGIYQTRK